MDWTSQLGVLISTATAMALGGAIGLERELKNRPAGFRTHMLVAGAAALLVGIGRLALEDPGIVEQMTENLRFDPLRLVEAVIAGVAFIGAGAIFGKRGSINGITTAASLLMVSVIGIAAGFNYYVLATAATALTLLVLVALKLIDRSLGRNRPEGEHPPE
ncbi:MgtC/SapB family protein [Novilysobacter spongiicola]|nr:MgtC/SapB family protein [Lysobacter spongiicola]